MQKILYNIKWLLISLVFLLLSKGAFADGVSIIRDAEIEGYIRQLNTPVFKAAGLNPSSVNIVILNDNAINAFVAGGQNIYINTGLLLKVAKPEELLGVISHEVGHIVAGHLISQDQDIRNASLQAGLAILLGTAIGLQTNNADVASAIVSGGGEVAKRRYLSFSRTKEASADQAGLSFLETAGISAKGMVSFLEKLQSQELLPFNRQVEYVQTHPLTYDRIEDIKNKVEHSKYKDAKLANDLYAGFSFMQSKLNGFINPDYVLRVYKDKTDDYSKYALAIAYYRKNETATSLDILNELEAKYPTNPYIVELKGQVLFGAGKLDTAIVEYQRADKMVPNLGLVKIALAQVLIETGKPENLQLAIDQLDVAKEYEKNNSDLFRMLATAYGKLKNEGMAKLNLAEEAYLNRDEEKAKYLANAAILLLPKDSSAYQRANDLINLLKKE